MQVRRCALVLIEPRESVDFDLAEMAAGETGVRERLQWVALAAHCDDEIPLSEAEVTVLGACPVGTTEMVPSLPMLTWPEGGRLIGPPSPSTRLPRASVSSPSAVICRLPARV